MALGKMNKFVAGSDERRSDQASERFTPVVNSEKLGSVFLMSLLVPAIFYAACGSTTDTSTTGTATVSIPNVVLTCTKASAETCLNKQSITYYATGDCTVADMNASKYVAQSGTIPAASECTGDTCSTTFNEWYPVGTTRSGTRISTMLAGSYKLCTFIDTNGDTTVGNSGDYVCTNSSVTVTTTTAAAGTQAVSTCTAL